MSRRQPRPAPVSSSAAADVYKRQGKIILARDTGGTLSAGSAIDADGKPTTDPNKAAIPTALGGPKGGGLSLMFECLTSLIVGNPLIAPFIEDAPGGRRHMQNGLMIAIDISKVGDVGNYAREIDRLAAAAALPPRLRNAQPPAASGANISAGRGKRRFTSSVFATPWARGTGRRCCRAVHGKASYGKA